MSNLIFQLGALIDDIFKSIMKHSAIHQNNILKFFSIWISVFASDDIKVRVNLLLWSNALNIFYYSFQIKKKSIYKFNNISEKKNFN